MNIQHQFPKPLTIRNNIRTLLVYPPISKAERYGSRLGIFGGKQIPLGLFYLAAFVRKNGFDSAAIGGHVLR